MDAIQKQLLDNQKQMIEMTQLRKDHEGKLSKTELKLKELEKKLKKE